MPSYTSPLDHLKIADPCSADWEQMIGNERVRFCGKCNLNVYNLSAMTRTEAERLVSQTEGRLCARFYRRADGTILTQNCPVGLQAVKKRVSRMARAGISAVIGFCTGVGLYGSVKERRVLRPNVVMGSIVAKEPLVKPDPPPTGTGRGWRMGDMAAPVGGQDGGRMVLGRMARN
jgi:hypothetical protein